MSSIHSPDELASGDIDSILAELADPAQIRHSMKLGEQYYSSMSKEVWHQLRIKAKQDLFFLAYGILGFTRLSTNLHGSVTQWMSGTERDYRFRLLLLPRGHFKSTLYTVADSLRAILPDDAGTAPWPYCLGPDIRLALIHEKAEQASRFLLQITDHILSNPALVGLFPEIIPDISGKKKPRVNQRELELRRNQKWPEPTIDTFGVGGRSQGRHYNFLKPDDLIGDEARDSETVMRTAIDWIDNLQSFLSTFRKDHIDFTGTRWAFDDAYSHIIKVYGKQLALYVRPVEEFSKIHKQKVPIFPEEFTLESLEILRKNKKVFSAQYMNDPAAGDSTLNRSDARYFYWSETSPTRIHVYNGGLLKEVDEELSKDKSIRRLPDRSIDVRSDLNIYILFDPATSGYGGYIILGMDEFSNVYILEAEEAAKSIPEQITWLFQKVMQWQPREVAIEKVLFSELYGPLLEAEQKLRKKRFRINLVSAPKDKTKEVRIAGLAKPLGDRKIFFAADYKNYSKRHEEDGAMTNGDPDILYEIAKFGGIKEYHVLDALELYTKVAVPAVGKAFRDQMTQFTTQAVERTQGYSKISYRTGANR